MRTSLLQLLLLSIACTPADRVPEAAAGYEAQQMACVDRYATRGEIDRCRAKVKAEWATVPDAGTLTVLVLVTPTDAGAKDGAP